MGVSDRDKSVLWPYTVARNQNLFEKMKHQGLDSELTHFFFFYFFPTFKKFAATKQLSFRRSCLITFDLSTPKPIEQLDRIVTMR